jgi:hypothetical protein
MLTQQMREAGLLSLKQLLAEVVEFNDIFKNGTTPNFAYCF